MMKLLIKNRLNILCIVTLLITFFTRANNDSYSIVFIHLGESLPVYIHDSIEQAYLFNSHAKIYLVAHKKALISEKNKFNKDIVLVNCEDLPQGKLHAYFMAHSTLNTSFRDGFWRKATERFFYLDELIGAYKLSHVFHLEYDNMLYVDLAELLPVFKNYHGIAAIFDTEARCVPNFMYIPDGSSLSLLVDFIAQNAKKGLNDMNMIGLYKTMHPKNRIDSLPIVPPYYDSFQKPVRTPQLFYNNGDAFNSLFDGAALGQYLGGIDPRNGPSLPGFINQDCVFNPTTFDFMWVKDNKGRNIPYMSYGGKKYRINNLHIHSKKLKDFKS